jgi:hypothetical protein
MSRLQVVVLGLILLPLSGCDADKINSLEKQNADLKSQLAKQNATEAFDLQAKCSVAAKQWFRENWGSGRDKDDIFLDFNNHYDKVSNQCFIWVMDNRKVGTGNSWSKSMSLWDVFENWKYADFLESHMLDEHYKDERTVDTCQCKTPEEFNGLTQKYMND